MLPTPLLLKTYEIVNSLINGEIRVEEREEIGIIINIQGLAQSGGTMVEVWNSTLQELTSYKNNLKRCLILGLGGGNLVQLLKKYYPKIKITGVEIDPIIIELGEKYLGLNKKDVEIVIADAYEFNTSYKLPVASYDLILVDIYLGREIPKKFDSEFFIERVKKLLSENGIIVFNRVNLPEFEARNKTVFQRVNKLFTKVIPHFVNENLTLICFK